jgi:hypothetical protein
MTDLGPKIRDLVARIHRDLRELTRLISDHPEVLDVPSDRGQCPHGNGPKRRCKICARDYMRDYRKRA